MFGPSCLEVGAIIPSFIYNRMQDLPMEHNH